MCHKNVALAALRGRFAHPAKKRIRIYQVLRLMDFYLLMKHHITLLFVLLAGCNTAGPHFRGLPATTVTVDGSTFDVRVRGELAEAIRTNSEYAPRFGPIRERAGRAMAMVSGCEVKEVRGDQSQATGILRCGKGSARPIPVVPVAVDCVPVRGTEVQQLGGVSVEIDCS